MSTLLLAGVTGLSALPAGATAQNGSVRISRTPDGAFPNQSSDLSSVSGDGRYVVYQSTASNVVPGTPARVTNVYLYDTQTKVTTLVSRPISGPLTGDPSFLPQISANGRYVVYQSQAAHLVHSPAVPAGALELYRYDVQSGRTIVVSQTGGVPSDATGFNSSIGSDGRFIAYSTDAALVPGDTNGLGDVYLWDARTGQSRLISHAHGGSGAADHDSFAPSVTVNGQYVAFASEAQDLVSRPVTADVANVYLADTSTGQIRLVSSPTAGGPANSHSGTPAISANGKVVVFASQATNLLPGQPTTQQIFGYDVATGQLTLVSDDFNALPGGGAANTNPSISATGRWVAYIANPVSHQPDGQRFIVRHDLVFNQSQAFALTLPTLYPTISGDGQHIGYDRLTGQLDNGPFFDRTFDVFLWNVP